jgi:D-arabinose 1-dehydrogenase-like Zn-dependent alcohol dehydrogenase
MSSLRLGPAVRIQERDINMTTYKAVEVFEPGKLRVVERPISEPGPGQVRIRVEACGICHTDAATVLGIYPGLTLTSTSGINRSKT